MLETLSPLLWSYFTGNVHVRNMMLHANAATLRGLTYFCGLYNVVSGNHSVQIHPGGGGL